MKRIVLVLVIALGTGLAPARAGNWTPAAERSRLAFHGSYQGEAFDGVFKRFDAKVAFDAATPAAIAIEARIEVGSVDTQNQERDDTLATAEFFDSKQFPAATFRAHACSAAGDGHWRCKAELTIRDKTRPMDFEFTWSETGAEAKLTAQVAVDRLAFGVGTGDWADPELIARAVEVDVELVLKPAP